MEKRIVQSIKRKIGKRKVYNIKIADNHNYFVNGILTHNCDDPHNVKQSESDIQRKSALDWWFETMATRINDPENAHRIVVMQRLHENDLTGEILERELNYEYLFLPAEFEVNRRCKTIIFTDPRKEEGELLWSNKYNRKAIQELKKELGSEYAIAGQLQQRPSPRGGGMFQIDKFEIINNVGGKIKQSIRYWDKAATQDGGAFTAGVLMHKMEDNSVVIADVVRGQWSFGKRNRIIKQTAEIDGRNIYIWMEQEPGSGGKESIEISIQGLIGWRVKADRVTGSKEVRAEPYADQVEIGNVKLLKAFWNRSFIDEHESFPTGRFKDQVDAAAGAFNKLFSKKKRAGVWGNVQ